MTSASFKTEVRRLFEKDPTRSPGMIYADIAKAHPEFKVLKTFRMGTVRRWCRKWADEKRRGTYGAPAPRNFGTRAAVEAATKAQDDRIGLLGQAVKELVQNQKDLREAVKTTLTDLSTNLDTVIQQKLPDLADKVLGSQVQNLFDRHRWVRVEEAAPKKKPAPKKSKKVVGSKLPPGIKIDPDYYYVSPDYKVVEKLIGMGRNTFLVGPAGTGKSRMARVACENLGKEYYVMNLNERTDADDFVGVRDLRAKETVWTDGLLPRAMREGKVLIIDELDAASAGILLVMQAVLEGQPLVITANGGEIVYPKKGFGIVATANTVGRGDDSSLYPTANILNEAFLDRWHAVKRVWYIPEEEEVEVLIQRTGVAAAEAKLICQTAGAARSSIASGQLCCTFSTRKSLAWAAHLVDGFSMRESFELACLNKVADDDRKVLAEIAQRILGIDPREDDDAGDGMHLPEEKTRA